MTAALSIAHTHSNPSIIEIQGMDLETCKRTTEIVRQCMEKHENAYNELSRVADSTALWIDSVIKHDAGVLYLLNERIVGLSKVTPSPRILNTHV